MSLTKNQAGALNPLVIVLIVVVVAAAGFAGYRVYESNKDKKDTTTSQNSNTSSESKEAASAIQAECLKQFDDKDFCKFSGNWINNKSYKGVFTTKGANGSTSVMTIESEGDNSSSTITADGKETGAYITLNKVSYMKNVEQNVWYKLPATDTEATDETKPNEDLNFDTTSEEVKNTTTYKKIGKEACGDKTCFKYQVIDTADTDTIESFIWFDDKDYHLARMTTKSKDGSSSDSTFTYTSVKITEPSPVQDMPGIDDL